MKRISIIICVLAMSASITSCRLFQGGGGGGHCPAYGMSLDQENMLNLDINNDSELQSKISERM